MRLKLFFLTFILLSGAAAQESPAHENKNRVEAIPQLIQNAVNQKNYKKAAHLQKEEKIRRKMQIAFKNKNYERLVHLKEELENCNCVPQFIKENYNESINENSSASHYASHKKKENTYRNNGFVKYFRFLPVAYVKSAYSKTYQQYMPETGTNKVVNSSTVNDATAGGFRLGGTIFFGDMREDQKFKVGFDILFASFTAGMDLRDPGSGIIYFSIGQPGVMLKNYFNKYSGLQLRFNIGNSFGVSNVLYNGFGIHGNVSYWFKNFSIGIEYQYASDTDNMNKSNAHINQIGLTCGFHF